MDSPYSRHRQDSMSSPDSAYWPLDQFVLDPGYLAYREELRHLIFNTAQTAAPTRQGSPLDMFDSQGTFAIQVPLLARHCPALLCALLALSARQMERKEGRQHSFDSLELYQDAIRHLNPLLQAQARDHTGNDGGENDDARQGDGGNVGNHLVIVPICVILCCLEMMSASPRDWRRHLEGCATLFEAFGVNGFSGDILQSVFWCYARMDLCGALISDGTQATLVPTHKFLLPGMDNDDGPSLFSQHRSPDMHANYAVYLCSLVCELIADRTRHTEMGENNGCDAATFDRRWLRLWHLLQDWVRHRPADLVPLKSIETRPFPQILFAHWAAISSHQLYHTACILLLSSVPHNLTAPDLGLTGSPIWHAKRICGISLTNPHQGCLNNAIQPLWIAGRLLSHRSEHLLLVELIRSIESMTGWATSWRISDLEAAWGYKISTGD
ncbi:C6 transcription factor [Geosmithia morbida]|uniref:C6 transcription factor n=1 Tax=Geosmithia morbida TaxID=1094350 RepID=A0A9P4Z1R9_9HYPO|nr:C6 transcription factor [Geosmithia morbida]KAF4126085.1 C6 transcription factor [Geosmithia morbida]